MSKEDQQLLETLSDARAYHEKEYEWERQRIGNGGSRIAAGQHRRYADAIAIAAIRCEQLEEAKHWMQHTNDYDERCGVFDDPQRDCDCGLKVLLASKAGE